MLQFFDPQSVLGMVPPCFVRKVDTMSDCGRDEQIPEHREPTILDRVLDLDPAGALSIYKIEDALALARIALAINQSLGRYLTQDLILVPMSVDELQGIDCPQINAEALCIFAKERHYDLRPSQSQRQDLANLLANRLRMPKKLKDSRLKKAKTELEMHGCRTLVPNSMACHCD